jgi:hypothetical protein
MKPSPYFVYLSWSCLLAPRQRPPTTSVQALQPDAAKTTGVKYAPKPNTAVQAADRSDVFQLTGNAQKFTLRDPFYTN